MNNKTEKMVRPAPLYRILLGALPLIVIWIILSRPVLLLAIEGEVGATHGGMQQLVQGEETDQGITLQQLIQDKIQMGSESSARESTKQLLPNCATLNGCANRWTHEPWCVCPSGTKCEQPPTPSLLLWLHIVDPAEFRCIADTP